MDYQSTLNTYGGLPPSAFVLESPTANSFLPTSASCPRNPKTDVDIVLNHSVKTKRPKLSKKSPKTIFSSSSKAILNSSFVGNPYPEKHTLKDLASRTKHTIKQIRTFFANKRSRTMPNYQHPLTDPEKDLAAESQMLGKHSKNFDVLPMPLNRSSLESLDIECDSITGSLPESLALSRFLETSVQDDYVDPAVIEKSARESPPPGKAVDLRALSRYSLLDANSLYSSAAGSAQSASSARNSSLHGTSGTNGSAESHISSYSLRSHSSRVSKRGRRKCYGPSRIGPSLDFNQRATILPDTLQSENRFVGYNCTFCQQHFLTKYSWRRHEESIHVPRTWWICNSVFCAERSEAERTFFRKDNFEQHLAQTHKYTMSQITLTTKEVQVEAPPLPLNDPALRCPFCSEVATTWEKRVDHVAWHLPWSMNQFGRR